MAPQPNPAPSRLDELQNLPRLRQLLLARFAAYDIAVRWQLAQLGLVVLIPLMGAFWAILNPDHRAAVGALAVFITILDVAVLDRRYRRAIKQGAKAAEHFDSELFQLPWNSLSAGDPLSPEVIKRRYESRIRRRGDQDSYDWYPVAVGRAPLHIARIICQRANVSYDSSLRRHYSAILLGLMCLLSAAIFLIGLLRSATLADVVITAFVPPAPILVWALREFFRQTDAADANDMVQKASETLLNKVLGAACDEPSCTAQSVELQTALFSRRATNPLLFPGVYKWRRRNLEAEMDAGADYWLEKAGYATQATDPAHSAS